jgi:hypothetical protein
MYNHNSIGIGEAEALHQTIESLSEVFPSFEQRSKMQGKGIVLIFKIGLQL